MLSHDRVLEILTSRRVYDEELVKIITNESSVVFPSSFSEIVAYKRKEPITVKLEGLEILDRGTYLLSREIESFVKKPCTVHLFWADKDSLSFGEHTDPMCVFLKMIHGSKTIYHVDREVILTMNSPFYHIYKNTLHKPINTQESMMLSIGLENHIELM